MVASDAEVDDVAHDCILRCRYSLIESFLLGVMGAAGSGVVRAGFSRGSWLAVLVNIFGYDVPVLPSVDRLSATLVDVEESRYVLPPSRSVVRSVPREEESVEKLDGRDVLKPFSNRLLISVEGRYW